MRLLLFLPWLAACSPPAEPEIVTAPAPARPSLILVTLDTTRADHLGAYGHAAALTPTLDRLAAEGTRFDRAYATVPLTTPSHASMLTGLYPPRHGVRSNGDAVLPDAVPTVAERLQEAGYATAASVSAFVTTRVWNLDQGFDAYYDALPGSARKRWGRERAADAVVDDALVWLEDAPGDAPWFLWVHFYDPHAPFQAPERLNERFAGERFGAYDAEIAFVDEQIARLRGAASARAGAGGLAWVIAGDHGEALEDTHGELGHGLLLYDETMRVPLIVRGPEPLAAGRTWGEAVSVADVAPTLLALAGLGPLPDIDGVDLLAVADGSTPRAPVYMESLSAQQRFGFHPEQASAAGTLKLMDTPAPRLFDLAVDPGEQENLVAARPADAGRLREAVRLHAGAASPAAEAPGVEVMEQLAALGYVTHDAGGDEQNGEQDIKENLDLFHAVMDARRKLDEGDAAGAEAAYRELLANPETALGEARLGFAQSLMQQERHPEAVEAFGEGLANSPESSVLAQGLANALAADGQFEAGLARMEAVLERVPGDDLAQVGWLRMNIELGRYQEAAERAQTWLSSSPDDPTLQAHLGIAQARLQELEAAEVTLLASLSDGVPRERVEATLGDLALARGDRDAAAAHWREELEVFPGDDALWHKLGNLYMTQSAWEQAADAYAELALLQPGDVTAQRGRAQAIFNSGDYAWAAELLAPALAAAPDDPEVLRLHANLLAKQGLREEALEVFERAKALRATQQPASP